MILLAAAAAADAAFAADAWIAAVHVVIAAVCGSRSMKLWEGGNLRHVLATYALIACRISVAM